MSPQPATAERVSTGEKHLEWIPVSRMRISPRAQRKHNGVGSRARIDNIAKNFDPDKFGALTVNLRDDVYWIIDGGHRYYVLKAIGYERTSVQCWTYHGLSEEMEADKFLALNDVKPVSGMDKFLRALVAKHPVETDIDRIVRAAGMTIGTGHEAIGCVGALLKTYRGGGPKVLASTMRVLSQAYGKPGFSAKLTEGTGLFIANYENLLDEQRLVERLSAKKGGVNGLLGRAEQIRQRYGIATSVGVAAAIVETYNQGRGGQKLNGWWSTFNGIGDTE